MGTGLKDDSWVWVIVQNPGAGEQFLGQHDTETDVSFIPAFLEKEEAGQGLKRLVRDQKGTYEIQAIQVDHLAQEAERNGFQVFLLNGEGTLLEKILPADPLH